MRCKAACPKPGARRTDFTSAPDLGAVCAEIQEIRTGLSSATNSIPVPVLTRPIGISTSAYQGPALSSSPSGNGLGMAEMVDLFERKSLKLLAQAGQTLNQIVGEGPCGLPIQ